MHARPWGGNTWQRKSWKTSVRISGGAMCLFCSSCRKDSQSSFCCPVKPDSKKQLRGDRKKKCFYSKGVGKWLNVECGCGACMTIEQGMNCVLCRWCMNVKFLSFSHKLHMWHSCVRESGSRSKASATHKTLKSRVPFYAALTRVSSGIKEALRAKEKAAHVFSRRKGARDEGGFFPQINQGPWEAMCTERQWTVNVVAIPGYSCYFGSHWHDSLTIHFKLQSYVWQNKATWDLLPVSQCKIFVW